MGLFSSPCTPAMSASPGVEQREEKEGIDVQSHIANAPTQTLDLFDGTLDPVYEAKARILNDAIQEIGMGKYQVKSTKYCMYPTS